VKQDLGDSYKWFAIAAKSGDKDAAQKRDDVAKSMKPDQLATARTQVDLWKPQPLDPKANSVDIPDEWGGKSVHTGSIDMKKAIRNIQAILNNNGFDAGPPDGSMGAKTVTALKSFQKSVGLEPDGKVSDQVVKQLLARNKQG
jgi:localization factor PodJL